MNGETGIETLVREPGAFVLRDLPPEKAAAAVDWSAWYLTDEEDMGQSPEQCLIIKVLVSCIEELLRERDGSDVHVGSDQFFAWVPKHPLVRVSPDVFLFDDPPSTRPLPPSWQTWRPGHRPPRLAVEVVSQDWAKDYDTAPPKYAQLGTQELVVFDPQAAVTPRERRVSLQVYRRQADDAFARVHAGDGPARCEQLDAWLVVAAVNGTSVLRLARDADGKDLVPTTKERAEAEGQRADAESHRADAESHRADAESQRAEALRRRAEAAEQRVRELERERDRET